jgi:hypothetical protein
MAEQHPIPNDSRFQDLNGRVFGKLTVLFYAGRKSNKYSLWHTRCECGNERTLTSSELTLGRSTSCVPCKRHKPRKRKYENLTGQVFGRLTVLGLDRHVKSTIHGNRFFWKCKCSCGEFTVVRSDLLKDKTTPSCGCANIVKRWHTEPKPDTIVCKKCKKSLPSTLEFFYRHPSGRYGFLPRCKECIKASKKIHWKTRGKKYRMLVLNHYSNGTLSCSCCNESHIEFLTIDHIHGGGNKHRKQIYSLYPWLVRNKFPEGFRVLCYNCNLSLGKYGYCPHSCLQHT